MLSARALVSNAFCSSEGQDDTPIAVDNSATVVKFVVVLSALSWQVFVCVSAVAQVVRGISLARPVRLRHAALTFP